MNVDIDDVVAIPGMEEELGFGVITELTTEHMIVWFPDSTDGRIRRQFKPGMAKLEKADDQDNAVLRGAGDKLSAKPKPGKKSSAPKAKKPPPAHVASVPAAWEVFAKFFPEGFKDAKYMKAERDYKVEASELAKATMSIEETDKLMADGKHAEFGERLVKVLRGTNLPDPIWEIRPFEANLKACTDLTDLANAWKGLLTADPLDQAGFDSWVQAIEGVIAQTGKGKLSWPLVTAPMMLARPDVYMALKPVPSQAVLKSVEAEVAFNYTTKMTWECFSSLMACGGALKKALAEQSPVDWIDVQSFIWVVARFEKYKL